MSSPAAIAFDALPNRTREDLETFWQAAPTDAAAWVSNVAHSAGLSGPALTKIDAAIAAKDEVALGSLLNAHPEIFKLLGNEPVGVPPAPADPAQAPDMSAVEWIVNLAKAAPAQLIGRFVMGDNNIVKFQSNRGTYDVDLAKTSWREEVETAFFGRLMTVRGEISEDGAKIIVLDLAPGTDPHFISGRVQVNGDAVTISPGWNANISVKVTNPEFKKLLLGNAEKNLVNYNPAGVILPGHLDTDAEGKLVYPHNPAGFYILGRVMEVSADEKDGHEMHRFHTGYFRETDAIAPADMQIPEKSLPGKGHWDPNDQTKGSTKPEEGRRTFFFVKILPPEKETPFTLTRLRRIEVKAVLDAADQGSHAPGVGVASRALPTLVKHIPASSPDGAQEGFAPPGISDFKYA